MKFLLYATTTRDNVEKRLGTADYSYFFLLRAFAPLLEQWGDVVVLEDAAEADAIYQHCVEQHEDCRLLSFLPPHKTPMGLSCPVIPVFAWEYPDIPERIEEACWEDDPRHDWRYVLHRTGRAITLSSHTVAAVRRSMGSTYRIAAIPPPISATPQKLSAHAPLQAVRTLRATASVSDSRCLGLDPDSLVYFDDDDGTIFRADDLESLPPRDDASKSQADSPEPLQATIVDPSDEENVSPVDSGWNLPPIMPIRTPLQGVVYTTVLLPAAGRKNWEDLISAFCWAFRDTPDATLILKLAGDNLEPSHHKLLMLLSKMSPIQCRVLAIYGYLSDDEFANLIDVTTYYVNTSLCEGLCLPLVEFLAHGVPAIAPDNTAMADYIDDQLAFVVNSYPGVPTVWPHGDDQVNRTTYHQLDWQSLIDAYRQSYRVAKDDTERYQRLSQHALDTMQTYCGPEVVSRQLHDFFFPSPCTDALESQRLPPLAPAPRFAL